MDIVIAENVLVIVLEVNLFDLEGGVVNSFFP